MSPDTDIEPENMADRELAIAYGEFLDGNIPETAITDPLYGILNTFKTEQQGIETSIDIPGKEAIWDRILIELGPSASGTGNRNGIFGLYTGSKWFRAAAALILIASTVLLTFMLTRPADPLLLASAESGIRMVELRDGSAVTLRPNSSLYEISYTDNLQHYRLDGEALFDIHSNPSREFQVSAGRGEVTVLGTRFNLYERDGSSRVDLIEGSVRFRNSETLETVTLRSGEAAEITENTSLSGPITTDSDEATGWTRNRLTFRDRQMSDIIKELEFHYGIRITAPESVLNESLGGSVPLENAGQTLRDLGMVLGGEFRETGPDQFEFRQN